MKRFFTSESVTEGHPDKLCDKISDSILDKILSMDKNARVACECCATTGTVFVMGEITCACYIDIQSVVRETIKNIGYTEPDTGFDYRTCAVMTAINEQSTDIAMGVDNSVEHRLTNNNYDTIGAGDQGMMFGYASDETEELMPLAISLAHKLTKRLTDVRRQGLVDYLRPDGKAQVTVEYDGDIPKRIEAVVISTQHKETVDIETLRADIKRLVADEVLPKDMLDSDTKYYINPTGRFVIGGPAGDSGLTGRKIIVDTYGGYAAHGGGCFSGKDPTKVDRSAAYYVRYVAKNIVKAGLAKKCELEVAYAIGKANPVSISINTFNTSSASEEKILEAVKKVFDFRPLSIIEQLDLRRPIYSQTTNYGHFGREGFSWEKCDRVDALLSAVK